MVTMRLFAPALACAVIACALAACGIGVEGELPVTPPSTITTTPDAGGTRTCSPKIELTEPFADVDPLRWKLETNSNFGFPQPVTGTASPFLGASALSLIKDDDSRVGMWLLQRVPTISFDVQLAFSLSCPDTTCDDGLAIVWLETTSSDLVADAFRGRSLAIPRGAAGGAVAIDLEKDPETDDGDTPALSVLDLTSTGVPGGYKWTKSTQPIAAPYMGTHTLSISARRGTVEARVDGGAPARAAVHVGFLDALFGITASGSGSAATMLVRDLRGKFYDCDL
jgi:hypothetical protein